MSGSVIGCPDANPVLGEVYLMAWITGGALTPFGKQPGPGAVDWQTNAAHQALEDAAVERSEVDALLTGYATTLGHLMPGDLLAETMGIRPKITYGMNAGGATGLAMIAAAAHLVDSGQSRTVLVAAGENRASGQSTDTSIRALAQVGHHEYEVPLGANVPAYYALLASYYLHKHDLGPQSLAPLAVQMRTHAGRHDGAHFRKPISVDDVLGSRTIADPLRLLDCCPISDGGAAFVVSGQPRSERSIRISGIGQAHQHQHISQADFDDLGARISARAAFARAGWGGNDVDVAGVYDSFTITLAMLLEEIGFAEPGRAGIATQAGYFDVDGAMPLNTHGGLLSYGHSGVAGGMAHLAEVVQQLRGEAGVRQVRRRPRRGFVHADGGVMSAHISIALERE